MKSVKQTNSSSQASAPIVTILTPSLNCVATIGAALDSVAAQTDCPSIEHIVLDGVSSDGTLDVLSCYPQATVISERDANLYDALNKGLRIAGGEVIGLLNADDTYSPDAVDVALGAAVSDMELAAAVTASEHPCNGASRPTASHHGVPRRAP